MSYKIGIDVGGTFTDFILVRPAGEIVQLKVPSTLDDQSRGVMDGIAALAEGGAAAGGRVDLLAM